VHSVDDEDVRRLWGFAEAPAALERIPPAGASFKHRAAGI